MEKSKNGVKANETNEKECGTFYNESSGVQSFPGSKSNIEKTPKYMKPREKQKLQKVSSGFKKRFYRIMSHDKDHHFNWEKGCSLSCPITAENAINELQLNSAPITHMWLSFGKVTTTLLREVCNQGFRLQSLTMCGSSLQQLPKDIGKLRGLKMLNVRMNEIQYLPFELTELSGTLVFLDLAQNKLNNESIECVYQLRLLESLNLSKNKLTGKLNDKIDYLHNLRYFHLSYNRLTGLPDNVFLPKLVHLDLSKNRISMLPPTIGKFLKSGMTLLMVGNKEIGSKMIQNLQTNPGQVGNYLDSKEYKIEYIVKQRKMDKKNEENDSCDYMYGYADCNEESE